MEDYRFLKCILGCKPIGRRNVGSGEKKIQQE
jgi:hypothetical protein